MSLSNFIKTILNIQKVNKEHLPETICIDEFKSVKNIVKKNLAKKEKVSKQMFTALKTLKKYIWKYV